MGVPAFFRWLSRKYPSIVVHCVEEQLKRVGGVDVPVDATLPNPNDVEFDNLYLDMNGIIHPCCHPEDRPAPENEDEMMVAIFEYIDRIFNLVRPRKVLYMAIDGVAPRAKMNQQRSRRFRSAKESIEKLEDIKRIREELRERGCELPPLKPDSEHFDSNCITPGTPFMAHLSVCLLYYIHDRMTNVPAWKDIKVILSDANVPGEGEHKIMDYIRKQRASPAHDPNTHHCLCGADADLIMLGLATHEPYFTILREEFKPNTPRPCEICNQVGHSMKECKGEVRIKQGEYDELNVSSIGLRKDFIFIRISVLREYLERELKMHGMNFKCDLERAIDDWVFMCFFVGNDFLPHLPSLQIREGAIDRLIKLYKEVIPSSGGYLTHNGYVDVRRVKLILADLGAVEDEIFRNRRERDLMEKERRKFKRRREEDYRAPRFIPQQLQPVPIGSNPLPSFGARSDAYQMRKSAATLSDNQEAAKNLKSFLKKPKSLQEAGSSSSQEEDNVEKKRDWKEEKRGEEERLQRKRKDHDKSAATTDSDTETEDEIRLWEDGWKDRYYETKFDVSCEDTDFVSQVVESYTEGLCWVMAYYYQGCPLWKWFFPFHYAPFASDFKYSRKTEYKFEQDTLPFQPLEQLMGVFPAASCKFLPPAWQELMLDHDSEVIDFYPSDFKIDLNGKKFAWQGVALLPFVNEKRLLGALTGVYHTLSDDERFRNALGCDYLFMHKFSKLSPFVQTLYEDNTSDEAGRVLINPDLSGRISGEVWANERMKRVIVDNWMVGSPLPMLRDIPESYVISVNFHDPQFPKGFEFEAQRLPGIAPPPPTLKPEHMGYGRQGSYNPQIGFSQRNQRNFGAPDPARRMIRHSLPDEYPQSHHHGNQGYPPPSNYPSRDNRRHQSSSYQQPRHYSGPPSTARWAPLPPPPSHNPPYHNDPYSAHNPPQHSGHPPYHNPPYNDPYPPNPSHPPYQSAGHHRGHRYTPYDRHHGPPPPPPSSYSRGRQYQ